MIGTTAALGPPVPGTVDLVMIGTTAALGPSVPGTVDPVMIGTTAALGLPVPGPGTVDPRTVGGTEGEGGSERLLGGLRRGEPEGLEGAWWEEVPS